MIRLILLASILIFPAAAHTEHLDLDQLLREVKQSQSAEGKINRDREAKFVAAKEQQTRLLAEAKAELAQQESASQTLKLTFESNEAELTELEAILKEKSGVLGEIFGVVRQAAGDLKAELENSMISSQFKGRGAPLEDLAGNRQLPTIEKLEALWYTLQQEMTESGKVVKFPAQVMSAAGEARDTNVVRIGPFNALADGLYLRYVPETGQLMDLARQPDSTYLNLAEDAANAEAGTIDLGIDPTRGAMLNLLVQTPGFLERIEQGGVIGYFILAIGLVGLIIVIHRLIALVATDKSVREQLDNPADCRPDNPLGRVLAVANNHKYSDLESLEYQLDEAILRETPELERGQSIIKLLAAIAPLLGLLGTVTGMIATFQSISLFGTGDPKLMASGISQALVTTMLGLIVAIPLLFMHSLVTTRSRALVQIIDEQSAGLISRAQEKQA